MKNIKVAAPQKRNNSSLTNRITRKQLKQLAANTIKLQAIAAGKSTEIHYHIEDEEPAAQPLKQGATK